MAESIRPNYFHPLDQTKLTRDDAARWAYRAGYDWLIWSDYIYRIKDQGRKVENTHIIFSGKESIPPLSAHETGRTIALYL